MIRSGRVYSAELCKPLPLVILKQMDDNGAVLNTTESDESGHWELEKLSSEDQIIFEKEGFCNKTIPAQELTARIRLIEDRIVGYLEKLWFYPGDRIEAKVHALIPYSATLCRHGLEKSEVLKIGKFKPQIQTVPDDFFVETGLDWQTSFNFTIPDAAKPGLYSILLASDGQESFAIPLIISTPAEDYRKNRLLVLASNTTWQSYNLWGGRNRYRSFENEKSADFKKEYPFPVHQIMRWLENTIPLDTRIKMKQILGMPQPAWKFKHLTTQRPFTNCLLEGNSPLELFTNHLASGEWRVLAWLEREGRDYDMVSGFELHQNPGLLNNYDAVILSTHCEYWSKEMFEGLKSANENGLWVLNLSGNSIYREIEFDDSGQTRCTSLFFEHSCADETEVTGVRFTANDYGTCAPFKVTQPDHWAFKGVSRISKGMIFANQSLNRVTPKNYERYDPGRPGIGSDLKGNGGSGWETDKLSRKAKKDFIRIAKGTNKSGGADMVIREPDGDRGGVFSASSITFGGTLLIDDVCARIVRNVLKRAL